MGVRVYTMVEADELLRLGPEIATALFRLPASVVGGEVFSIARGSGFLYYADPAKLWTDLAKRALPRTETAARAAALAFVARAARDVAADPCLAEANLPEVLPPVDSLLHLLTTRVRNPANGESDHWLCRFAVTIRPSDSLDEPAAPVAGAGLDLRIGDRGEVIGLTSRWVPLRDHRTRPRRHLPQHLPHDHDQAPAARLVYRLNDEAARQTLLAPYWLVADGHHQVFFPASDRSLLCEILQSPGEEKITLTAITAGGTGAYEYTWGCAMVTQFPPRIEPIIGGTTRKLRLGTQETTVSSVSIDATVCDVLLDVLDTLSGARVQLRRSIYPLMTIPPEPPPVA